MASQDNAKIAGHGSDEKQLEAQPTPSASKELTEGTTDETPRKDEESTYRHVSGKIPRNAWLVASFSGAERFAWFALTAPLQNYIQNPATGFGQPGALGKGQNVATALNCFLNFLVYTTPIFAGMLADGRWGPYKTIVYSCCLYLFGITILLLTSTPPAIQAGVGLGGLIVAFVLLGLGVGGIKSSIGPFTADQLQSEGNRVVTLASGEKVIEDHEMTVRRVYSTFYWCTNIGALSGIASTTMEKYIGFWAAYLLAFVALALGLSMLILGRTRFFRRKPQASFRANLLGALACAIRAGFKLDAAEPTYQYERHNRTVSWDKQFVADLREALKACKVWTLYPIVWLCFGQNQTNLVSQAGQMITHGIPNDAMMNFNPICVIIAVPALEHFVYPTLQKFGVPHRPTVRMTIGFFLIAVSMAVAAGVQQVVYNAPPCYNMPLQCPESKNGSVPNQVSVMLEVPIYVIGAIGEVFFSVSGSEYAYNKAAPSMKSTLQAITMSTMAMNSLLGLAVSPVSRNPYLTILFASFAGVMTITSVGFGWLFWSQD